MRRYSEEVHIKAYNINVIYWMPGEFGRIYPDRPDSFGSICPTRGSMGNIFRVCGVKAKAFAQPCLAHAMSAMACPQAFETIPLILAAGGWDPETSRRVLSVVTERIELETVVVYLILA